MVFPLSEIAISLLGYILPGRPAADGVPSDWLAQCDWASWRSIFAGIAPKRRELWRPQGKSTWATAYSGAVGRSRAKQFVWPSVVCTISNSPPPRQIGGVDLFGGCASKTCLRNLVKLRLNLVSLSFFRILLSSIWVYFAQIYCIIIRYSI